MGFLLLSGGAAMPVPVKVQETAAEQSGYAVTLTAYNAVPEQTDSNPHETASGAFSNPELIAARSRDLAADLPFGTIIEIEGPSAAQGTCGYDVVAPLIGYRVIADTMNARFTDRIDILLDTQEQYATTDKGMKNAAQVLGICKDAMVRVVGHVDIKRIPKTQVELARIVKGGSTELALK